MLIPDEFKKEFVQKGRDLLDRRGDAAIVAVGKYGVVLRDEDGNTLIFTTTFIEYTPNAERKV